MSPYRLPYQRAGFPSLGTLTYLALALARARQILWLVTGEDKKEPLARLLAGDMTIPAGRIEAAASLVMADRAAA